MMLTSIFSFSNNAFYTSKTEFIIPVTSNLLPSSAFRLVKANFFGSPGHKVLRVSYCDSAVSDVHRVMCDVDFLPCVRSRGHIFSPIIMKRGQNVGLDKISDEFENGSCQVEKLGH